MNQYLDAFGILTASTSFRSAFREMTFRILARRSMVDGLYPSFLIQNACSVIRPGAGGLLLVRGVGFEPTKAYATG